MIIQCFDVMESLITAILLLLFIRRLPSREPRSFFFAANILFCIGYISAGLIFPAQMQTDTFMKVWGIQLSLILAVVIGTKHITWLKAFYICLIFFLPMLFGTNALLLFQVVVPNYIPDTAIKYIPLVICNTAWKILIIMLLKRLVKIEKMDNNMRQRLLVVIVAFCIWTYVRLTINQFSSGVNGRIDLVFISIFVYFLIVILLITNEKFIEAQSELAEKEKLLLLENTRFENEKNNIKFQDHILRLNHDFKNIMIGLEAVAYDSERVKEYLHSIQTEYMDFDTSYDTGNEAMSALLGSKFQIAKAYNISTASSADFTSTMFISPIDIFTIFGNALDNAIEAAQNVSDSSKRCIRIKAKAVNQIFVCKIENSYQGELEQQGDIFTTTKNDTTYHGIGFYSMRQALEKYSGNIRVQNDQPGIFCLTIIIPIPDVTRSTVSYTSY